MSRQLAKIKFSKLPLVDRPAQEALAGKGTLNLRVELGCLSAEIRHCARMYTGKHKI